MGLMAKATLTAGLTAPVNAAETILFTTPVLQTGVSEIPGVGTPLAIRGVLNITPGGSTTAIIIRVRQGTLVTGTLVGASPSHTVAAAAPQSIAFSVSDGSGWLGQAGGGQYVITVQQTGGAANGTPNVLDYAVEE